MFIYRFSTHQALIIIITRSRAEQRWKKGPGNIFQCSVALFYISVTRRGAEQRWKKGPGNVFSKVWLPNSTSASHGTERTRDGRKVQGMYFPMFGCLILHQRNTERSGTEMEERSRECIFQCSVALFYSFPPSLSPFRSVPFRSVFPGNIEIIFYFLSLPVSLPPSVPLRCVPFFQIKNGMEPNEME